MLWITPVKVMDNDGYIMFCCTGAKERPGFTVFSLNTAACPKLAAIGSSAAGTTGSVSGSVRLRIISIKSFLSAGVSPDSSLEEE